MSDARGGSASPENMKVQLYELRNFVAGMGTDDPDAVVSASYISHLIDLKDFPDGEFKPYAMARIRNTVIFTRLLVLEEWLYNKSTYLSKPDTDSDCYKAGKVFAGLDPYGICLTALCFAYGSSRLNGQEMAAAKETWRNIRDRVEAMPNKRVPTEMEIVRRGRERGLVPPTPTLAAAA